MLSLKVQESNGCLLIFLRELHLVIVATPAKYWEMSFCPPAPLVALHTQPELVMCAMKLLLLSLKQQRSDGAHCTIIGSLDGLAKNAIDIARVTGLWRKAPGL